MLILGVFFPLSSFSFHFSPSFLGFPFVRVGRLYLCYVIINKVFN